MKGDFVKVLVMTPGGLAEHKVVADFDGASVDYEMGKAADPFMSVEVVNRGGAVVRADMFAKSAVTIVSKGHEQLARKKAAKR